MYRKCILLVILCFSYNVANLVEEHLKERNELLAKEFDMMLGSDIELTESEKLANRLIMGLKHKIVDDGFESPQYYNFSRHFFTYKEEVKENDLYKIIKSMPKGALLHVHDTGIISADYLVRITYWDNLYACFVGNDVKFLFSKHIPTVQCGTKWQLLSDIRSAENTEDFDAKIRKHFTIVIDNPQEVYTDVNTVWAVFVQYFIVTTPLLTYKPAWEYYFYETLREIRSHNIMFTEIRSVLPHLYDLEGNTYDSVATAASLNEVFSRFVKDYPDFIGAKLIYAPHRLVPNRFIKDYIEIAREIKRLMPNLLAGFDLVGQEDLGYPTIQFLPELTEIKDEFEFFFHAGETGWYGTTSDENIADAIVLGTRRLGHAYGLAKHPALMDEVKKRDIAVEVNVLSNAVLGLVSDVRNHPLATYIARGIPVVLSSDDPGAWDADVLTHDFFVSFVGVASRHADLRLLKKLALNSLKYSTIQNKSDVLVEFEKRWSNFINSLLTGVHTEL